MRTWIVGEAPGRERGEPLSCGGASGRRLAKLCGLSHADFESRFARCNLFDEPSPRWDAREARLRALAMEKKLRGSVVLLGRRVAHAFGAGDQPLFAPRARETKLFWALTRGVTYYVAPHPSGRNRWWNYRENVERAERFWGAL